MTKKPARSNAKKMTPELALSGGAPAVKNAVPNWPIAGDLEVAWMEGVVRSGAWSWKGHHETAFSREFQNFIGSKYCLCLANGTVTIQCALQAVGVRPGDEVIVPGLTWVATAQAVLDIGADVVLVDVNPDTMSLDPKAFDKAITPKTKAVIPVHLYGCMCDMDAIMKIAQKHNIKVVEDVAHQHGSRWRNIGAGAIGDAGSFSFQQSKVLTSGEGGAVTCNDEEIYRIVHCLKQVGWGPDGKAGNEYGHNYRITEMQAVLLRGGMTRILEQTLKREENAAYLTEQLAKIGGPVQAVKRDPRVTRQAYYAMTLKFDPRKADGLTRSQYANAANREGCALVSPYAPVYANPLLDLYSSTSPVPYRDQKKIQNFKELKLPGVEKAARETGLLIMHYLLLADKDFLDQWLIGIDKVNSNLKKVAEILAQ
ncbi:MAG: DegT/DnrJ/EryC1/StrS family aminotransferase [Lentisphaerae bacterium]|nr:DegT/DnrJ/EryC1/StrS family aminotransferase [Lentisphaerota bacterium]